MTITYSQTARDVVQDVMQDRGLISLGASVTAEELSYGLVKLNDLLKGLAVEGVSPWTNVEGSATITADTASVVLDPRPIDVLEARLTVSATYERPLTRWEHGEYVTLPNKAQTGDPLIYTIEHTPTQVSMVVWPVPSTDQTITYSYDRVIEDVEASTVLDVPQLWGRAIKDMLAAELTAFEDVPPAVEAKAMLARRSVLDHSRPESYTIER